jgi:hypothetical protein
MTADVYPLQVLLVTLAGWINRHQQHVIEYLVEEGSAEEPGPQRGSEYGREGVEGPWDPAGTGKLSSVLSTMRPPDSTMSPSPCAE